MSVVSERTNGADISVSVPANLLLMGEYAVTRLGRVGVAMAVDRRAHGSWKAGGETMVEGRTARSSGPGEAPAFVWPGDAGIMGRCADELLKTVGDPGGRFVIDTSTFHRADGTKLGYGSSAATVLTLAALWYRACGLEAENVMQRCVELHRNAQGGSGSGYDVVSSFNGGVGLFHGGAQPEFERVDASWLPRFVLFHGSSPVKTVGSVRRFNAWMKTHPAEAERALDESDGYVGAFVSAGSWKTGKSVLQKYRDWSIELGDRIGVNARIEPPGSLRPYLSWWKAVGAGNELGIAAIDSGGESMKTPDDVELAIPAQRGLSWR